MGGKKKKRREEAADSVSAAEIALGCFSILPTAHLYNTPLTLSTSLVLETLSFFRWPQFIRYSTTEKVNSMN